MNNNYNNFDPYGNYINYNRNIPNYYNFRNIPNFYNMNNVPNTRNALSSGILAKLFPSSSAISSVGGATSGLSFSSLLSGASKTLGVINQAIPVFYQIKPIWNNAKTMLRVAKVINNNDENPKKEVISEKNKEKNVSLSDTTNNVDNGLTFFK